MPVGSFYDELHTVEWEKYVYVKCLVCKGVYRYGIYGFQEGAIGCVYCGTLTWNPILVPKIEYLKFLESQKNPYGLQNFQQRMWGTPTEKGTDEEYQRR
jgi:hypothetical protein